MVDASTAINVGWAKEVWTMCTAKECTQINTERVKKQ
jgi:hypothetical protein